MKSTLLFLFLLFFFNPMGYTQEQLGNDSLLNRLKASNEDTNKVDLLITICNEKWKYAEYAEAKKSADEALSLSIKIGYKNGIAEAYNQTGIVYWYLKEYKSALEYHIKALAIYEETGNKFGISNIFNRMGHDYADMLDYSKALEYFQKALKLDEEINNLNGVSKNLDLIGYVYMNLSDYPKALEYYFKALELAEKIDSKRGISAVNHDIGSVLLKQNKASEALIYATKGLTLALEVGEKHLLDEAYTGLENIYLNKHDFEKAYQARLKYDEIENEIRNADHSGKIKQMQMAYDFAKREVSDSLQFAKEREIDALKFQKQKTFTYGGIIGIIVTITLLFFVYRNYNKQRLANQKLIEAQEKLLKSEKMAAFGLMASRISHEIQNPLNFVNNLSSVSLELLEEVIHPENEEERKQSSELLKSSLQKIHEHGKRASVIVNQLQEHSEKGTAQEFFETRE